MISVQPFAKLGAFRNAWLNARHHFSFGQYHDPSRAGVGGLLVWNDDEIAPGMGFDPHPHRDMEIITFVRQGAITHRDSLGHEGRTEAGDVQVMHAGTGIVHAEYNNEAVPTRLFQIWIRPTRRGVAPGWATRAFPQDEEGGLVALADGREANPSVAAPASGAHAAPLPLHADGAVLAGRMRAGQTARLALGTGRAGYLVAETDAPEGVVLVNGVAAGSRDGVTITGENEIVIEARDDARVVLVDVAA